MSLTAAKPQIRENTEARWRQLADSLPSEQLDSGLIVDLHRALDALESGRTGVVERWLELMENRFIAAWHDYESTEVLEDEITAESILGHHMLREGLEGWLETLDCVRAAISNGAVDRRGIFEQALEAQRMLVSVQRLKADSEDLLASFLAAWRN